MNKVLVLASFLLMSACVGQSTDKVKTPPEQCHALLDALCEQVARCPEYDEPYDETLAKCMDFMAGRINAPFISKPMNLRDQCDRVEEGSPRIDTCIEDLRETCQFPDSCDL